jgi:hypothetical protein
MAKRPYGRREYNRALILNALLTPFNIALLALMLIAGIVLGVLPFVLPVAVVLYGVAAARTYLDEDVAAKVLERERTQQRAALESGRKRLEPEQLAPPIRKLVQEARFREARIADAIERAELPFAEVATEVDGFVTAMDRTAQRAQLLHEALEDTPTSRVRARLERARDDPQLAAALETQLHTLERMEGQLKRFYAEMERMLVELDTVRSQLVSVSASTETAHQTELAGEVRALRERMGTVAEGMSAAYEA